MDEGIRAIDEAKLLELWRDRAKKSSKAHYQIASRRLWWNALLSGLVVFATTSVGSGLAVTLTQENPDKDQPIQWIQWILAGLGLVAAILAGLQRVLSLAEMGERHRAAGAEWDAIFNSMCLAVTLANDPDQPELGAFKKRMDELVARSPSIPQKVFNRVSLECTYARLNEECPGKDSCEESDRPGAESA